MVIKPKSTRGINVRAKRLAHETAIWRGHFGMVARASAQQAQALRGVIIVPVTT